jgi:hypothetical protein
MPGLSFNSDKFNQDDQAVLDAHLKAQYLEL